MNIHGGTQAAQGEEVGVCAPSAYGIAAGLAHKGTPGACQHWSGE
jgi:hypothetical protein